MISERYTIVSVEPLAGHGLRLGFADGEVHEIDLAELLSAGGVFVPIYEDRSVFEAVRVDGFGTIVWPGDVDLDPIVLRGDERPGSGAPIPRRVVIHATSM